MVVVNGKAFPKFNFKKSLYSITLANVANARYFRLSFKSLATKQKLEATVLSYGQGFIYKPKLVREVLLGPGERVTLLLNLTAQEGDVLLENDAPAPFPTGDIDSPPCDQVLLLHNTGIVSNSQIQLPPVLNPSLANELKVGKYEQQFVLVEHLEGESVQAMYLNGQTYHATFDSNNFFERETTELYIVNLTPDSHPFHTHLVPFQLI